MIKRVSRVRNILVPGYKLNPDMLRVQNITSRIMDKTDGHCPCVPFHTWNVDNLCPCVMYLNGKGCHCGLYIKE